MKDDSLDDLREKRAKAETANFPALEQSFARNIADHLDADETDPSEVAALGWGKVTVNANATAKMGMEDLSRSRLRPSGMERRP